MITVGKKSDVRWIGLFPLTSTQREILRWLLAANNFHAPDAYRHSAGWEWVRYQALLERMNLSPNSGSAHMQRRNLERKGLVLYAPSWLALTNKGNRIARKLGSAHETPHVSGRRREELDWPRRMDHHLGNIRAAAFYAFRAGVDEDIINNQIETCTRTLRDLERRE